MRMSWRLVLCLFGHLTLLFFLAIYLVTSLNSVRLYTPVAQAEELSLESLNTMPALLGAMDAERMVFQKSGDAHDLALYSQSRDTVLGNLDTLNTPLVLPTEAEKQRRALIRLWISDIGDFAMTQPKRKVVDPEVLNKSSRALLGQIHDVTEKARGEIEGPTGRPQGAAGQRGQRPRLADVDSRRLRHGLHHPHPARPGQLDHRSDPESGGVVRRVQSGDYTARADLHSGDEIQSPGRNLQRHGRDIVRSQQELREKNERLSEQQEALRNANASLEERVLLKTKELEDKNQKLHEGRPAQGRIPRDPEPRTAHAAHADHLLHPPARRRWETRPRGNEKRPRHRPQRPRPLADDRRDARPFHRSRTASCG